MCKPWRIHSVTRKYYNIKENCMFFYLLFTTTFLKLNYHYQIQLPAELTAYIVTLDVSDILLQITTLANSGHQKSYPRFNCVEDIMPYPYLLRLLQLRRCRMLPEARPVDGTSGGTVAATSSLLCRPRSV